MADIPVAPFFYGVSAGLAICAVIQAVVAVRLALEAREAARARAPLCIVAIVALLLLVLARAAAGIMPLSFHARCFPTNKIVLSLIAFALMWVVVLGTVPLGAAMGLAGLLGTAMILGLEPALSVMGSEVKNYLMQPSLSVLPLFLLMGAFAALGGVGSDLYRLAYALIGHRRGGLANATIAGCAAFGALTGSSMATQVPIGRIAMPEMRQRGYSPVARGRRHGRGRHPRATRAAGLCDDLLLRSRRGVGRAACSWAPSCPGSSRPRSTWRQSPPGSGSSPPLPPPDRGPVARGRTMRRRVLGRALAALHRARGHLHRCLHRAGGRFGRRGRRIRAGRRAPQDHAQVALAGHGRDDLDDRPHVHACCSALRC